MYDIIVVGGGFSGVMAACAAAREKQKVLLVEKSGSLGGAAVLNSVLPFMNYMLKKNGERVLLNKGLFAEFLSRLYKYAESDGGDKVVSGNGTTFNEEFLKIVMDDMTDDYGVEVLFHATICDVLSAGGKIKEIKVVGSFGVETLQARYFVDATGDAVLSLLAGASYHVGREKDGKCQPMTLCFRLGNVKARNGMGFVTRVNKLYKEYQAQGKIKNPREDVLVFRTVSDDIYHFNTTRVVKLDPTNAWDVTKAELAARDQVFEMISFLRENFEEFKDCVLLATGMQIGARESRMIVGEHTLTQEELKNCTRFDDSIAVCNYDIDIHSPDGSGTSHYYFKAGQYYTIPYRCLIPKGMENLLVSGRCISATHEAQASVRIMPTCCTLGEAAGIAAAIAQETQAPVKDIDVKKLQKTLEENGAKIY